MPVALLMPTSSSGGEWRGQMPLNSARRYARGRSNSRWHRIRAGMQWPSGRVSLQYWCGQQVSDSPDGDQLWTVDELPESELACGTCVGRALGAGQDDVPADLPPLRFDPRWQTPPRHCPGSRSERLWVQVSASVGRCLACGEFVGIRAMGGGGYNYGYFGAVQHDPGPGLVAPCPFHAWHRLVRRGEDVACACGWPYQLERAG